MKNAAHKDPTFEAVLALELREKNCRVCVNGSQLTTGRVVCFSGLRFPYCQSNKKNGFKPRD